MSSLSTTVSAATEKKRKRFSHKKRSHQIIITINFKSRNYLRRWINRIFFRLVSLLIVRREESRIKREAVKLLIKYRLNFTIVNVLCMKRQLIEIFITYRRKKENYDYIKENTSRTVKLIFRKILVLRPRSTDPHKRTFSVFIVFPRCILGLAENLWHCEWI